jgi:hypothetical protein
MKPETNSNSIPFERQEQKAMMREDAEEAVRSCDKKSMEKLSIPSNRVKKPGCPSGISCQRTSCSLHPLLSASQASAGQHQPNQA